MHHTFLSLSPCFRLRMLAALLLIVAGSFCVFRLWFVNKLTLSSVVSESYSAFSEAGPNNKERKIFLPNNSAREYSSTYLPVERTKSSDLNLAEVKHRLHDTLPIIATPFKGTLISAHNDTDRFLEQRRMIKWSEMVLYNQQYSTEHFKIGKCKGIAPPRRIRNL